MGPWSQDNLARARLDNLSDFPVFPVMLFVYTPRQPSRKNITSNGKQGNWPPSGRIQESHRPVSFLKREAAQKPWLVSCGFSQIPIKEGGFPPPQQICAAFVRDNSVASYPERKLLHGARKISDSSAQPHKRCFGFL